MSSKLPKSWAATTVGEVYQVIGGGTPTTGNPDYWSGDTPWITSADIEGVRQFNVRKYVSEKGIAESTTNKVPAKTLLVVTRVGLGKIAITEIPVCFSQDLQGLIQKPDFIYPEFALYLLSYQLQFLKYEGQGTTISGVTKKQLKDLAFLLPPIPEQHRIVAKIEELFSELDKGIENLKTARAQLKVYRQALLKHAFEGKLTAQWREERRTKNSVTPCHPREGGGKAGVHANEKLDSRLRGNDDIETADALLKRIQQERAQRYQQQLADWQINGGSKPKAPKPMPPLTAEELAELPELQESWGWELIGRFANVKGGKRLPAGTNYTEYQTSHPYIRVVDFENLSVRQTDLKYLSKETQELISAYTISSNDTYISIAGTIGRVGTVPDSLNGANLTENAAKICEQCLVDKKYLAYWLHSVGGNTQLVEKTISTTQPKLALFRIEKVAVPVCCIAEQEFIVELIESRFSEVDQLELTITTSLQQAEALRQSILKKAFSGQLVSQDPDDEPASALLARIKAGRATAEEGSVVRKRSKRG